MNNPNPQSGRRIIVSAAFSLALLVCGILAVFVFGSGTTNINVDIDAASWPLVVGWFLVADGLLSFFGGLLYIARKLPRLGSSSGVEALRSQERANLSARDNQQAEGQIQAIYRRVWRVGITFMIAGGVSLFFAVLLLTGVISF